MSLKEITEQNKKQIHFYFGNYSDPTIHSYTLTQIAINSMNYSRINTTQIVLCTTDLFRKGYRIFIHPAKGNTFEIKLGDNSPYTDKDIRMGHNLYKLLIAGTFNTAETSVC